MFKTFNSMMHLIAPKRLEWEIGLLESSILENQIIYHIINKSEPEIFHSKLNRARTYSCKFSFLITVLWTALEKILKNVKLTSFYIWMNQLIIFRQNFTFSLMILKERIEYILNCLPISTKYIWLSNCFLNFLISFNFEWKIRKKKYCIEF